MKREQDEEPIPLPQTCDVKEGLIVKLQELDGKVGLLIRSNKAIREELADDPEVESYIRENEEIMRRTKDTILRILNAFMEAGIDIDKEGVLLKMPQRHLYMPGEGHKCSSHGHHGDGKHPG